MIDQFYTPTGLAALLVDAARVRSPKLVADFAMGDGALLRAAERRWPRARLFGSDIDGGAIEAAGDLRGRVTFATGDFLAESNALIEELADLQHSCDVVLLNPPFSCRGYKRFLVSLDGEAHCGSKALAFVCRALGFLRPGGEVLAIVPASCATSQRDLRLMTALRKSYAVEQIGEINRNAFEGCSVNVILWRIKRHAALPILKRSPPPAKLVALKSFQAMLMRGSIPVHRTSKAESDLPVLHTVDLRAQNFAPRRWTNSPRRVVEGRAILLPRVGRPDLTKAVLADVRAVALSDCVIAIQSSPPGHEAELYRLLRTHWAALARSYGGCCAPYITLVQLQEFFLSMGVASQVVSEMRSKSNGEGVEGSSALTA